MKKNPVVQTALRFGFGVAVLCLVWSLILYWTGQNPFGPKRLISAFWPPIAVLLSQWYVRRYFQPDGPGLKKALLTGALTAAVAAVLSAGALYGLGRWSGPRLIEENRVQMEKMLAAEKASYLKLQNGAQLYETHRLGIAATPQALAADDFQKKLLLGLLLAIPGGIFFRK
ncbi:DUF4199 family protein [Hymenobacter busanensis]|uniref:DUF4199 family protein n=1 Tax=Hymenobacter busanensis TaxID=2607656 RepID=A0A7L5A2N9_9BACT|nr:DUF4199 family protein [Hymenobacter busanensis]KAA9327003.1 DUF4199 family protein [Hymenobacter busanensis]QHJ09453.1 DUF4199 family protein [Hymenobacter busanensis]